MADDIRKTTLETAKLYHGGMTLDEVGKHYEMSRQAVHERFQRFNIPAKPPAYQLIDEKKLTDLYLVRRFGINRIAEKLEVGVHIVRKAIEFYKLPKRRTYFSKGKYQDFLRDMKVGDKNNIEINTTDPYVSIYVAAKIQNKRISMRKIGENVYEVTRVE